MATPASACPPLQGHAVQSADTTSVSANSDESGKQSLYSDGDLDRHQNLTGCSLAHCQPSLKISCKSMRKFLRKVAKKTEKQTDKQRRKHILLGGGDKLFTNH